MSVTLVAINGCMFSCCPVVDYHSPVRFLVFSTIYMGIPDFRSLEYFRLHRIYSVVSSLNQMYCIADRVREGRSVTSLPYALRLNQLPAAPFGAPSVGVAVPVPVADEGAGWIWT